MLQGKSRYNESYENENTADHTAWACDVVNSGEEQLGTTKARAAPSFPPDHPLGRAATSDSGLQVSLSPLRPTGSSQIGAPSFTYGESSPKAPAIPLLTTLLAGTNKGPATL